MRERQIKREEETYEAAVTKKARRDADAAAKGRCSTLEGALCEKVFEDVKAALGGLIEEAKAKRGPRPMWWPAASYDLDLLTTLAVRVLASMFQDTELRTVSLILIRSGHLLATLFYADKALAEAAERDMKPEQAKHHAMNTMRWQTGELSKKDQAALGVLFWNALNKCGLALTSAAFLPSKGRKRPHRTHYALVSDKGAGFMQEVLTGKTFLGHLQAPRRPMIAQPLDWTSLQGGGYYTSRCRSPVVRGLWGPKGMKERRQMISDNLKGSRCLDAVNALQRVPLRINTDALWLRDYVWDNGIYLPGQTPRRHKIEVPPKVDEDSGLDATTIRRLRVKRRRIINMNKAVKPLEAQWMIDSREAEGLVALRDEGLPFYLPHDMDYRGRTYATPSFSHQRGDAVKGLFEFFRGVPLGKKGLDGLKIHVANCCDFEKVSKLGFPERIAWVDDHLDILIACARDPEKFRLWERPDCDAPFSFFAAVCDLERALSSPNPEEYVSHIRVDLDGSNSGVQHYSAIMRAEEGVLVSLYPSSRPQDLYQKVAASSFRKAVADSEKFEGDPSQVIMAAKAERALAFADLRANDAKPGPEEKAQLAHLKGIINEAAAAQWARRGVTRSDVKRCTMTYNYASEAYGFADHIREDLMIPYANAVLEGTLSAHPFGEDEGSAAANYLGTTIFSQVERILPKSAAAMNWLKRYGNDMGKAGKPVTLHTPDGFTMVFEARGTEPTQMSLQVLMGATWQRYRPRLVDEYQQISPSKQRRGTPPQTIHCCDAAHLRMVVRRFTEQVSPDIMTIHDSFGSHAAYWDQLGFICRESLVWLYAEWDPLQDMKDMADKMGIQVPPTPEKGNMDARKMLKALYAFS